MGQIIFENMFYVLITDGIANDDDYDDHDDMLLLLVLQKVIPEFLYSCKNTNIFLMLKLLLVTCYKTSSSDTARL